MRDRGLRLSKVCVGREVEIVSFGIDTISFCKFERGGRNMDVNFHIMLTRCDSHLLNLKVPHFWKM